MVNSDFISDREQQVLNLIVDEYTTKEIASQLYISTHTVFSHRKNLMQKLKVRNTAGLVREGFRKGLLSILTLCFVLGLLGPISMGLAGVTNWTGAGGDHDWFNATNWDNGVPTPADSVLIDIDSVIINNVISIEYLAMTNGARLVVTPSGSLSFNNSINAIECLNSLIYNYGIIDIQVPSSIGVNLIGTAVLNNLSGALLNIFGTDSLSIKIDLNGELRNQSGGQITIQNCNDPVINDGLIDNRGAIQSNITGNASFKIDGIIDNSGTIAIDSSSNAGVVVESNGEFINNGMLSIQRIFTEGVIVKGDFKNQAGSKMIITESKLFDGIEISSTGRLNNKGLIDISNIDKRGIQCFGTLVNSDSIIVQSSGLDCIEVQDSLINEMGGVICINNFPVTALDVHNNAILINHGNVFVKGDSDSDTGIDGHGKIENHNNILIGTGTSGIVCDTLINHPGANIDIKGGSNYGISVNGTQALLLNQGSIIIDSARTGLELSNATVMNDDTLKIINTIAEGIEGSNVQFENRISGFCMISGGDDGIASSDSDNNWINNGIMVIDSVEDGMDLIRGNILNTNLITIQNVETVGIYLGDTIYNSSTGRINIISSQVSGLEIRNGVLNNEGVIDIQDVLDIGLENRGNVNNQNLIMIQNAGQTALENDEQFENHGHIMITESRNGIRNSGTDTLCNLGLIDIDNIMERGLINSGHFKNTDSIIIRDVGEGILNIDTLHNDTSSLIQVTILKDSGTCITNDKYILNEGDLECFIEGSSRTGNTFEKSALVDDGELVIALPGSTWDNTSSSSIFLSMLPGFKDPIYIGLGAIFNLHGELELLLNEGG